MIQRRIAGRSAYSEQYKLWQEAVVSYVKEQSWYLSRWNEENYGNRIIKLPVEI